MTLRKSWLGPAVLTLAAAAFPAPALAQQSFDSRNPAVRTDKVVAEQTRAVSGGPNDRSTKESNAPDLQIETGEDGQILSFSYSLLDSGGNADGLSYTHFSFRGSIPIASEGDDAPVLSLKSLPAGTQFTLGFTHHWGGIDTSENYLKRLDAQFNAAKDACEKSFRAQGVQNLNPCSRNGHAGSETEFIRTWTPMTYRQHLRTAFPKPITFVGVDATGNKAEFERVDSTAIGLTKDLKFSYRGSVYFGQLYPADMRKWSVSFSYVRGYEKTAEVTVCDPINTTRCVTGAGVPVGNTRAVVSFEGRQAFGFSTDGPPRFAVAPELSYDITNEAFSADVPFYFTQDKDGVLSGGLRFSYLNERKVGGGRQEDSRLTVFVGVPFNLFKQ